MGKSLDLLRAKAAKFTIESLFATAPSSYAEPVL